MPKRKKKEKKVGNVTTQKRVSFQIFLDTAEKFEMTPGDLCEALGYSRASHNAWRINNKMPKVTGLACEGLKRRNGIKQEIIIRADKAEVIIGDGTCKEVHPGLFVLEL